MILCGCLGQFFNVTQFAIHRATPNSERLDGFANCAQLLGQPVYYLIVLAELGAHSAQNLPDLARALLNRECTEADL